VDRVSLFAGKLHALLTRIWDKGRDWFDLVWYLTEKQGLRPNLALLQNALNQTGYSTFPAERWKDGVLERLGRLDWNYIQSDVAPFLERENDLGQIRPDLIAKLVDLKGSDPDT